MSGQQHMVVMELKAWGEATALDDGNVLIPLGGGLVTDTNRDGGWLGGPTGAEAP